MRRGRGPRPLTLRPLHPAQVAHLERGGGHAARTRHYLYGKPAYCKLPHEVGMDAGFEARLQKLCLAQKADFKVVALPLRRWKSDHNTHHVVCNAVEHDPNIQHMPMLAVRLEPLYLTLTLSLTTDH